MGVLGVWRARVFCGTKIPEVTSCSCSSSVMVARSPDSSSSTLFKGNHPRSAIAFFVGGASSEGFLPCVVDDEDDFVGFDGN